MNNKKATKRALLTSVMALVMCVVMLVGTTFAWFTDTASTGVNKIQAGNLDVKLEYKNSEETTFAETNTNTKVFKDGALWEPGHVEYVVLKISNAGNLALKYKLGINIASETGSINVFDKPFKLSDYIRFAVLNDDQSALNRDTLVAAAENAGSKLINEGYSKENNLNKTNDADTVTLVVWMPTTVGNEANHKAGVAAPAIDLGIRVVATQDMVEHDSFGNTYDKAATYGWDGTFATEQPKGLDVNVVMRTRTSCDYEKSSITINNEEEFLYVMNNYDKILKALADEHCGGDGVLVYLYKWTVKLGADLNFNNIPMNALPFKYGNFDGQEHTIKNVNIVSDSQKVGLFEAATVNNLNVKNIKVTSSANGAWVGTVAGYTNASWTNVHVDGFVVTATGKDAYTGGLLGDSYGNKTNCSVSNGTINDGKNVGGFAGYIASEEVVTTLNNCSVSNVVINASDRPTTIGSFAGRLNAAKGGEITLTDCTVSGVTGTKVPANKIYGDIPNSSVTINGTVVSK